MGWANCGDDSNGRPIGYAHEATCDHEGCNKKIDRGLAYACGKMHGEDVHWCEGYFCYEHRVWVDLPDEVDDVAFVCFTCAKRLPETEE